MLHRVVRACPVIAIAVCTALVAGCSSNSTAGEDRVAEAYIVVIDWVLSEPELAPAAEPDDIPLVFVESLGPAAIDLAVQVDIVGHFEEEAEVRFIDARSEALEEEDTNSPVRDGGILVGLGAMSGDDLHDIRGEIYRSLDRIDGYRFRVDLSRLEPVLAEPPESVEPEGLVAEQ